MLCVWFIVSLITFSIFVCHMQDMKPVWVWAILAVPLINCIKYNTYIKYIWIACFLSIKMGSDQRRKDSACFTWLYVCARTIWNGICIFWGVCVCVCPEETETHPLCVLTGYLGFPCSLFSCQRWEVMAHRERRDSRHCVQITTICRRTLCISIRLLK